MGLQRTRGRVRGTLIVATFAACSDGATSPGASSTGVDASETIASETIASETIASETIAGETIVSETIASVDSSAGSTSSSESSTAAGSTTEGSTGEPDTPPAELEDGELSPGGATTVDEHGIGAFVQRAANLQILHASAFEAGLQFVQLDWEPAPGGAEVDGLGPTYNAIACVQCHVRNGRGTIVDADPALLLRLAAPDGAPDPSYGDQLQPHGIAGVAGEAMVVRTDEVVDAVVLPGGERVELTRPLHELEAFAFGPLAPTTTISPRLTPQLVGMGLLEAIADDDILAWADPDDLDGDGIAGRAATTIDGALGRFGWRAAQPSVRAQVAAAFAGDLGITSNLHPQVDCPAPQLDCAAAPSGGTPELNDTRLGVAAAYIRLLGVPSRRDGDDIEVLRGKTLFAEAGCDRCHRPSFTTGASEEDELAEQLVWPYTDLLLHDMGDGLADLGAPDGRLWRTPPLWGLGLVETVNGGRDLLHDGRASSLAEAILWHDGEAAAAREVYEGFDVLARARLHLFVESL